MARKEPIQFSTVRKLPSILKLRGRAFTRRELKRIQTLSKKHFSKGRTYISKAVCEALNWRQPNGWLKDRACRDVLRKLEVLKLIKLPKSRVIRKISTTQHQYTKPDTICPNPIVLPTITQFPTKVCLVLAKGNKTEKQWNNLVNTYHYLGHKVVVGRCLKYIVEADGEVVGAICFSSSAWHLEARNTLLKQFIEEDEIRDLVINNSRFLILPNVQVPNLASHILSLATRQISQDWKDYYSITPLVVETFVEPDRFFGTCYKAANWLEIGLTKGYAKNGSMYRNSQPPKQIFVYALTRNLRRKLGAAIHVSHDKLN